MVKQQTIQLAFEYEAVGETQPERAREHQADSAISSQRTLASGLMEAVVAHKNMLTALKRVRSNKGSAGVDGMTVEALPTYLMEHWRRIRAELLKGEYTPQPIRRVEIPKPDGGVRQLGIPTVLDRLIQQAIHQVLEPLYDPTFSKSSYGFRPGRSAHQALKAAKAYAMNGKGWVVDLDLEKFFDRVNHDILMNRIARRVEDKRLLRLIRLYLQASVMADGVVIARYEGTPQGGPLSPLLANILLDDFDKELEARGHSFCRYADDCNIYVSSERAGKRVMESLVRFLETKLHLKVNLSKSAVARPKERTFLGMRIVGVTNAHIGIARKSLDRFKKTVRAITKRNRGISLSQMLMELNRYTMGWVNYFGLAELKSISQALDEWIRRRLRCFIWKQWKKWRNRVDNLRKTGVGPCLAYGIASGKHGPWKISGSPPMTLAIPNDYLKARGYKSLNERYKALAF